MAPKAPALVPTIAREGLLTLKQPSPAVQFDQSFNLRSASAPERPTATIACSSCAVAARPTHRSGSGWGTVQVVVLADGAGDPTLAVGVTEEPHADTARPTTASPIHPARMPVERQSQTKVPVGESTRRKADASVGGALPGPGIMVQQKAVSSRAIGVGMLLVLAVSACNPLPHQAAKGLSHRGTADAVWANCGDGLQCATLHVPIDYSSPNGRQISLALIRKQATYPSNRIGSLLM